MFSILGDVFDWPELTGPMKVLDLGELGYGNPNAKISLKKQRQHGEINPEVESATTDIIASGECMVLVEREDDGCIDGRLAEESTELNTSTESASRVLDSEGRRALLAGGGYISMRPAFITANGKGESAVDDLRRTSRCLRGRGFICGAHTGSNAEGDNTDCGANDKFKDIVASAITFRDKIETNVRTVYEALGLEYNEVHFSRAHTVYAELDKDPAYFEGSTGTASLKAMVEQEPTANKEPVSVIVRRLEGDHNEAFIFLNFLKGTTFDQAKLLKSLYKRFPDLPPESLPQVFVIDIWRIQQLAQGIGETYKNHDVACMSGLVYQFATAATLTDGSLRVLAGANR